MARRLPVRPSFRPLALLLAAGLALAGCSGGGAGSSSPPPPDAAAVDTDDDGMSDTDEATPRPIEIVISVAGNATPPTIEVRLVWGDPAVADADGDGLDDATELREGSDPHATDTDGDGRSDADEVLGYRILVDAGGWGTGLTGDLLERRLVRSDPARNDSDGDGLLDDEEYELRTDPSSVDTDGDTLSDYDEWTRWWSSPVSVDSDEDARGADGSQAPNASLFDGNELVVGEDGHATPMSTSPTLADTDGDGTTDADEFDTPFRKTLLADVPKIQLEPAGEIDLSLFVTYAESQGQTTEYGTELTVGTSTETSVSSAFSTEASYGTSEVIMVGGEVKVGFPEAAVTGKAEYTTGSESSVSSGSTYELSQTSASSIEQTASRVQADSLEKTREAAFGRIRMGMRVRNPGRTIAYRLTNLGVTVLRWRKATSVDEVARFQAIATLRPQVDSIVLSPGSVSPVLTLESDDLPADTIEEFLRDPSSLRFETASFDLENAEGIDFRFLTENTFTQTAMIEIDAGRGVVERHLVATNVDRLPGGVLAGLRLGDALESLLGKTFSTQEVTYTAEGGGTVTQEVLSSLDGVSGDVPLTFPLERGASFWAVGGSRPEHSAPGLAFRDIRLQAGDVISLAFVSDPDVDGASGATEKAFGSTDANVDTDGDNLSDADEVVVGWFAGAPGVLPGVADVLVPADVPVAKRVLTTGGYPRRVWSSPLLADSDGDGLGDKDERRLGSDPGVADTDGDGLDDGMDPFPLIPALRLYVDASAPARNLTDAVPDGLSWDIAYPSLQDALAAARTAHDAAIVALAGTLVNNDLGKAVTMWRAVGSRTDADAPAAVRALVGEIWVAGGTYGLELAHGAAPGFQPEHLSFTLVDYVGLYGGFLGRQATAVGRLPETRRSQRQTDPLRGATVLSGLPSHARHVVTAGLVEAEGTQNGVGPACVLDGFVIEDGSASGGHTDPRPLHELLAKSGAGLLVYESSPTLRGVVVRGNRAQDTGGGVSVYGGKPSFVDCVVSDNQSDVHAAGLLLTTGGSPGTLTEATFLRCTIQGNNTIPMGGGGYGGGVYVLGGSAPGASVRFDRCRIVDNLSQGGGGVATSGGARVSLQSCEIVGNSAIDTNSGTWLLGGGVEVGVGSRVLLTQCLVAANQANTGSGLHLRGGAELSVFQCTVAGNVHLVGRGALYTETSALVDVRNSILADGPHLGGATVGPPVVTIGTVTVRSSIFDVAPTVAGFVSGSQGNLVAANPGFVAAASQDYRLASTSPAIDAGNAFIDYDSLTAGSQGAPDTDLLGKPRIVAGTGSSATPLIDVGAYERQP